MKLWKRNTVVAAVIVFVMAAVYFNWSYHKDTETVSGKMLGQAQLVSRPTVDPLVNGEDTWESETKTTASNSYFASARLNRQQARDAALSLYQQSITGDVADDTIRTQATAAMQTLANFTISEAQIENMIVAKGYADCVAFISENSISVVISPLEDGITDADVARVNEIVHEQTGFTASQIKLLEVS